MTKPGCRLPSCNSASGRFVGGVLSLLILSACSDADNQRASRIENGLLPKTETREQLGNKSSITERMDYYGVPGVSVAVFDDGKIVWTKGYGVVRAGENNPVGPSTLFQAASISKPVTAVGALRLIQEDRLRLDGDANDWLTSWHIPSNKFTDEKPVTLNGLLNHSAGVTVHGFPGYERSSALPSLVDILDGEEPANTPRIEVDIPVGSEWRYSGGGYTVVQQLLIDVSGRTFPGFMAEAVLIPMGMNHSTFEQPLPESLLSLAAMGHQPGIGPVVEGHHVYPEMSAAGLWTTATDLAKFAIDIHKSIVGESVSVLDKSMVTAMLTEQQGNYGLGVELTGDELTLRFSHSGINAGFDSMLVAYPTLGSGAVVMTNSNLSRGLIDEILGSIAVEYAWPDYPIAEQQKTRPFSKEELESYPATYDIEDGFVVSVTRKQGRLFMLIPNQGRSEIYSALAEDRLFVTGFPFPSFQFVSEETGSQIRFLAPSQD